MNGFIVPHDDNVSDDSSLYVEVDPTGRYGRYNDILGKGSSKIVYRAFDEYEGIEVAWNQVKLTDFLQKPEDLERLYSEIHLLKTLKHKNIMKFYASWVDTHHRNINFVTEMFTSGTLRQYRLKHKNVNIRAVKHWCRQILEGLLYLHSHDPPVIHRDLKCDNIFINGNQGEVKIGDLGLAAILRKSHAARCVGTPEFMAPEVYAEEYNELVDVYSFGMCVLEMVTFDYPYSECTHPAQIYKRVVSGKKPDALYKVKDPEVRIFVEKCLATVSDRSSARELLNDPFLQTDDRGHDQWPVNHGTECTEISPPLQLRYKDGSSLMTNSGDYTGYEPDHEYEYQTLDLAASEIDLFASQEDENTEKGDITIQGRRKPNGDIFLRLRITDKEGRIRNIYFPFDVETDTALSVASEMVSELEINDQDVTRIAEMIDNEITSLIPSWKRGSIIEETPPIPSINKESDSIPKTTLADFIFSESPSCVRIKLLRCSSHGSTSMRGRFEEITYQADDAERNGTESSEMVSLDIGIQHERRPSWNFHGSARFDFDEVSEQLEHLSCENDRTSIRRGFDRDLRAPCNSPRTPYNSPAGSVVDDNEYHSGPRKDMSLLKAKYQMQLRELRDQHLSYKEKPPLLASRKDSSGYSRDKKIPPLRPRGGGFDENDLKNALQRNFSPLPWDFSQKRRSNVQSRKLQSESCSPENYLTDESNLGWPLRPHSLKRTTSLPVDALDV